MSVGQDPEAWKNYWDEERHAPGAILWDVAPTQAAERDLSRLKAACESDLPLMDLGCGNGTQTAFLAGHFRTVIGTDVSASAVAIAEASNSASNTTYRTLDLMNRAEAQAFHDEIGDTNIYMRTVLHQMPRENQLVAARSIGDLIGATGRCYLIELSSQAEEYFGSLISRFGMPDGLARLGRHGVTPGIFQEDQIEELFPPEEFAILERGTDTATSSYRLPDGEHAQVPAFYAVIARATQAGDGGAPGVAP